MNKYWSSNAYWTDRMRSSALQSVGFRSFSNRAVVESYSPVLTAVTNLFQQLSISHGASILDAGAGIGLVSRVLYAAGYHSITAVDISDHALQSLSLPIKKVRSALEDLTNLSRLSIDATLCFDVLLHLTDDAQFEKAITNICAVTRRYIFIHGMFPLYIPLHLMRHARFRTLGAHDTIMKRNGFHRIAYEPTHFIFLRTPLYLFFGLLPVFFGSLDGFLLTMARKTGLGVLASHKILVYERK